MKIALKKSNLKRLSKDKLSIGRALTPQVFGGNNQKESIPANACHQNNTGPTSDSPAESHFTHTDLPNT